MTAYLRKGYQIGMLNRSENDAFFCARAYFGFVPGFMTTEDIL
jgi:hypothetical protein